MNKYLIINADGYGFTRGINRGIEVAVARGVITSISVNANFEAIEDLPTFVKQFPHISVGVHLNPVVGRPIALPSVVPSLVNSQGEFHYHEFAQRLMHRQINPSELIHELSLQIQKVRDMGVKISHLDSHQNQHLYPPYFKIFLQLLKESGVMRMRTHAHFVLAESPHPYIDAWKFYTRNPYRLVTHSVARYEMWVARRHGVRMADRLMSTSHTGDKAILEHWLQLLRNVPEGWSEVFCHPAYPDDELRRWATYVDQRRTEIDVMTCKETRDELARCGIELKSFHDLQ
ncbi:MAG: carbohydrate deacetylase [Armatimonadota bacterium]